MTKKYPAYSTATQRTIERPRTNPRIEPGVRVPEAAAFCSGACDCPSLIASSSYTQTGPGTPQLSDRTHDNCHGDTRHLSSMTTATVFPSPVRRILLLRSGEREK